jgi:hypothetical protein
MDQLLFVQGGHYARGPHHSRVSESKDGLLPFPITITDAVRESSRGDGDMFPGYFIIQSVLLLMGERPLATLLP